MKEIKGDDALTFTDKLIDEQFNPFLWLGKMHSVTHKTRYVHRITINFLAFATTSISDIRTQCNQISLLATFTCD